MKPYWYKFKTEWGLGVTFGYGRSPEFTVQLGPFIVGLQFRGHVEALVFLWGLIFTAAMVIGGAA